MVKKQWVGSILWCHLKWLNDFVLVVVVGLNCFLCSHKAKCGPFLTNNFCSECYALRSEFLCNVPCNNNSSYLVRQFADPNHKKEQVLLTLDNCLFVSYHFYIYYENDANVYFFVRIMKKNLCVSLISKRPLIFSWERNII